MNVVLAILCVLFAGAAAWCVTQARHRERRLRREVLLAAMDARQQKRYADARVKVDDERLAEIARLKGLVEAAKSHIKTLTDERKRMEANRAATQDALERVVHTFHTQE